MPTIAASLDTFESNIKARAPIVFSKNGEWRTLGGIRRFICRLNFIQSRLLKTATIQFTLALDQLEKQKVYFNNDRAAANALRYRAYLLAGQALCDRYGSKSTPELNTLRQRLVGLQYRVEGPGNGLNRLRRAEVNTQSPQFLQLRQEALAWKQKQLYPLADRRLSVIDADQLLEIARYPEFVPLVLRDPRLKEYCFKKIIRDQMDPANIIQYPATCERLHRCYIEPRIAYNGGLRISDRACADGGLRKRLTQNFQIGENEARAISILNEEKEVHLHGSASPVKIKDIFNAFRRKNLEVGQFEYFGEYENYNCAEPPLDIENPQFIEQMRTVRTYTREDLCRAFNISNLQDGQWVKLYRATRSSEKLAIEGCHAYLEIAVPQPDGTYAIKACGVLAATYPKNFIEVICFLAKTVFGKLYSPDDNIFMLTRQHCASPFVLESDAEVAELQEQVRGLFRESREKRLIFQAGGDDNCAAKVQRLFMSERERRPDANGKVKNLFSTKMIKASPMEPLGTLFRFFRRCPVPVQSLFIKFLEVILGGYSKLTVRDANGNLVVRSLSRSAFHDTHRIYTPCKLFKKIEKDPRLGVTWLGPDAFRCRVDIAGAA